MNYSYNLLTPKDSEKFRQLMSLYAIVFEDDENYKNSIPSDSYVEQFLGNSRNIVLVVEIDDKVIGGLVGYELIKFEQERKEIFVYDLAVAEQHQRRGLGTGLVNELKQIAKDRSVHMIFVEAEDEDTHAINFYRKLATGEEIAHHFSIAL